MPSVRLAPGLEWVWVAAGVLCAALAFASAAAAATGCGWPRGRGCVAPRRGWEPTMGRAWPGVRRAARSAGRPRWSSRSGA